MVLGPDPDLPTNIFGVHPNLTSLYLSDNRIVELPTGVFSGMSGVVTIRVQGNRLTRLQAGLFDGCDLVDESVEWFDLVHWQLADDGG